MPDAGGDVERVELETTSGTNPFSINAAGEVTGWFYDTDESTVCDVHTCIRHRDGTFTVFDAPQACGTFANAIGDDGTVTGWFNDWVLNRTRGFIRTRDGAYTVFDPPDGTSLASFNGTWPYGINAGGSVTGYFYPDVGGANGFVRAPDGSMVTFVVPDAVSDTLPYVNARGVVTGTYIGPDWTTHGFVRFP